MAKQFKLLICTSEYYPKGSGIANVVYNVEQELKKNGIKVDVCSTTGNIKCGSMNLIYKYGGIGLIHFWLKAKKIIRKNQSKYDAIWLHNPLIPNYFSSKKTLITTHTTYKEMFEYIKKQKVWKLYPYYALMIAYEKFCYKSIRKKEFTVTSNKTIEELKNLKVEGKITIVPNGAVTDPNLSAEKRNNAKNALIKKYSIKKSHKIFIYAGRLDYQKNIFGMADTFAELKKYNKNLTLLVVGDGSLREEFIKYIKEKNIKDVILAGQISYEQLMEHYRGSDYFIMASFYEGFPLTLLEGTSTGLIPFLSKIPIFEDFMKTVKIGEIVDFEKPSRAAKKIRDYLKQPHKQQHEELIKTLDKNYSWKKISSTYKKLIEEKNEF